MDERRKAPRDGVEQIGYIFDDGSSIRCVIKNISENGAAIELADPHLARPQFQLMLDSDRSVRECRLVWSSQNRIGIQFIR
ncbi:PilZ domain-containing protein [Bradyrhizobium sp. MOS002]|uniref:PilZ domain-containing protein n=1 Tax=Bradyrhizobium sp. MOS002 TaxID=2133947 RepID=UPI000D138986|nr:PilZ domain-containing protein [Bradyrhizobium sp. MOS002]PSO25991.1 PilZ domain-containing protein [Bradyrhizobium sp. MOS002]